MIIPVAYQVLEIWTYSDWLILRYWSPRIGGCLTPFLGPRHILGHANTFLSLLVSTDSIT